MSDPSTRIAHFLFDELSQTIPQYVNGSVATMIGIVAPVAYAAMIGYVIWIGIRIAYGHASFLDVGSRLFRNMIFILIGLNVGIYQQNISTLFLQVPSLVAAQLTNNMQGLPGDAACTETPGETMAVATVIDTSLCKGFAVSNAIKQYGDQQSSLNVSSQIYYAILAFCALMAAIVLVIVALCYLVVAYLATALLLAVGPFFFVLALFPLTRRTFEAWFGQLLGFAFVYILMSAGILLIMSIMWHFVGEIQANYADDGLVLILFLKMVGFSLLGALVMAQMKTVAMNLGGGVALHTAAVAGAVAAGAVGAAALMSGAGRAAMTGRSGQATNIGAKAALKNVQWSQAASAQSIGSGVVNRARRTYQAMTGGRGSTPPSEPNEVSRGSNPTP